MYRTERSTTFQSPVVLATGILCLAVSLLELFVFHRPDFYTLFSLGACLVLVHAHDRLAARPLFGGWRGRSWALFVGGLLFFCVAIDQTGMELGFWRYPHYGALDEVRKYIFEWGLALLYHLAAYRAGFVFLRRLGASPPLSAAISMLVGVTLVGVVTEWLNLYVLSWEVLSMPVTNAKIGPFFIIFQTLGYWLMVLFPYPIYLVVDRIAVGNTAEDRLAPSSDRAYRTAPAVLHFTIKVDT